jgi:hypothetical protein
MTQPTLTTPRVYRFDTKFELVENRSVRRSLDFEDEIDDSIVWSIRCVPLGHNAMFYLCRNAFPVRFCKIAVVHLRLFFLSSPAMPTGSSG